ncbi:flagellar associated protein [Reticulomyxa filosa]|uniref:Flagellar associated protein n=1 Tax=Reticulomyxa filosa TaxID=46433 RepID=X6M6F6_RETFI|nr:flagellar associated protein [Reticulomyxa filosa]|eukprot:ETO09484.1 flagellar associated protein [Reticulomyxa filosa]
MTTTEKEDIDKTIIDNPFHMPTNKEIFSLRMKQRESKQPRETLQHLITNASSKESFQSQKADESKKRKKMKILGEKRLQKESIIDFITKKREMFLVQMSLETKKEEICKLQEKAQLKEQALLKSEMMLEEDALRFDAFLKENDIKSNEAIKKYEKEAKEKQEKIVQIKKLNQEITKIKAEVDKYNETLEYCRKYKAFLDALTPSEWFAAKEHGKKFMKNN